MSRVAQMALLASKIPPAVLALQAAFAQVATSAAPPVTVASVAIGPASSGRTVFALVNWVSGSPAQALTSATIGGIAATIHVQNSGNIGSWYTGAAIISAQVPTGTTASIVLTLPASTGGYNVWLAAYSCTGLLSQTASDVFSSVTLGFSNHTENIDVVKDGILLSALCIFWDTTSTLTGVTRDYNILGGTSSRAFEGGSLAVTADEVNRPVKVSVSGTTNAVMIGAAFR